MHLLQSGVDLSVIALWIGHEHLDTTHIHMEADLALKEKALSQLQPAGQSGSYLYEKTFRIVKLDSRLETPGKPIKVSLWIRSKSSSPLTSIRRR